MPRKRVKEYENVFHVDNGLLFCNYCDLSVEWKHKSTIDAHFIEDLIESFANADIPLEKINLLLPFFKKHLKEGGAIPQASTLLSVDFLEQFNNSTIAQTLFSVLHFYNIPINFPRLFLSYSATYMKKSYRDVLKPFMPQLIHLPCLAHILNLIGEIWQDFPQFSLIKNFLTKIKNSFVKSSARKARYIAPCYWRDFYKKESEIDSRNETIKTRLTNLLTYLESNPAFQSVYKKFEVHSPNHPTRPLFRAVCLFDPKYMHTGNNRRHSIYQYSIISELDNPSDYIWLPISSCAVERSFSLYNTLLDKDRQKNHLQLNMMYFNRD
ncbi:4201_t:CDS:2 [Diversispora eburnea]|uniref:4201_t:CDS:1 n=1 Tax=Diversispora eburnea TaxID=1213867 RepID=A0A9N9F7R0_9GLOM|nr:4201_t:CDS:2 [Diversispora eburnea]